MKIKTAEYVTSFGMLFMFAYALLLSSFSASSVDVSAAEVNNDIDLLKSRTEISENDVTYRSVVSSLLEWKSRRRRRRQLNSRQKRSSDVKVCYPEIGCFYETGYIDILPNSPEEINTRFLFYNSKKCRGDTPLLDVSAQNMSTIWKWTEKAFNISASTKVIIHGFGSSCTNIWVYEMRSALMSAEDCNVICVDWEAGATIPNYVRAAANTRIVGKQVAMLISGLQKHVNLLPTNIHMIGFSLGAHVAGFAGTEIKNLSRITGLDPAGPLFESQDRRARLDSTDAKFVDVIHSNGENLILGGLGAWQPMGHVDFYPNGGRMQKGCTNLFVGAVSDMIWAANEVYGRSLCNHRRAYKFFTDSISLKCQFPAVPCESYDHFLEGKCFPCKDIEKCGNMGYYANKYNATGKLYLLTRDEEPFCAHQYMIKVESVTRYVSSEKVVTYGKIQIMLIGDLELNETFTVTQKKDEKIISGEVLSKIIVPHPAMQNFFHIQIIYTAYNGWLSTGLKQWSINKVSLIDSYNQKLSVCRNDLVLESGEPYTLPLYPGDCMIHETNVNKTAADFVEDDDGKHPQNISHAEENYTVEPNDTSFYDLTDSSTDSWTPLYYTKTDSELKSGNPLYKCEDCTESSEFNSLSIVDDTAKICALLQNSSNFDDAVASSSLYYNCIISNRNGKKIKMNNSVVNSNNGNSSGDYARDYLRLTTSKSSPGMSTAVYDTRSNGRSHNSKSINIHDTKNESASEYLNPPLEKATESWKYWRSVSTNTEERDRSDDVRSLSNNRTDNHFVVHFLPERLMSFLHKAEQYVKLALVPFMPDLKQANSENSTAQQSFGEAGRSMTSPVFNASKNRSSNVFRNGLEEQNFKIRRSNSNIAFMPYSDKQTTKRINPDSRYIPLHLAYNENTNQTDGQL